MLRASTLIEKGNRGKQGTNVDGQHKNVKEGGMLSIVAIATSLIHISQQTNITEPVQH